MFGWSDRLQPSAGGRTLVICPSRGRPGNIVELLDCWQATGAAARLVVCVDDDDPYLPEYKASGARINVGPRRTLGGWLNYMAETAEHYDIVGFIGDDVRPRSECWDARIAAAMPPYGVVYGDDGHQHERMPTHPFIDSRIIRRLGFIAPPGVEHLYIDDFWRAVGERLGTLTYLPDVLLEHMHPDAGKAEMDDLYRETNSAGSYRACRRAFTKYVASAFEVDLGRVIGDG